MPRSIPMIWLAPLAVSALALAGGCKRCSQAAPVHTTVRVHVPHASLTPKYCLSDHEASCREADDVEGLTHSFEIEQRAEGRLWCSYPAPSGTIRTPTCDDAELALPEADASAEGRREHHLVLAGCEAHAEPPRVGDACGLLTQARGLPRDSCGASLFCRSTDATCQRMPESCASDADCFGVSVCDETRLCVRFVCDLDTSQCVYPDECLDSSDCQRSHSRCDPETDHCDTFTCETGRCVGSSALSL